MGTFTSGAGLYGDNHDGYGVYGRSATSFGVVGNGYTATGVGVAGTTDSGIGVLAQATSGGVPFQVVAGSQPTLLLQSLQPGMMYVDGDGYWWIWQKDQTNVYGWRKVQAV